MKFSFVYSPLVAGGGNPLIRAASSTRPWSKFNMPRNWGSMPSG